MTRPIPDDHPPAPDDAFGALTDALVSLYLLSRDDLHDDEKGGAVVTVHAEHDNDPDVFLLKVGIGDVAATVMAAERQAREAAHDGGV